MVDRARSSFITLKSKRQKTEDDEGDFHFVNKRFKREGDLDNIQAGVTALVAILDSKNERKPDVYRNWSEEDFKVARAVNLKLIFAD